MNKEQLVDEALDYASDKVSRAGTACYRQKKNNLLAVLPKGGERILAEVEEAMYSQADEFYRKAMYYLADLCELSGSDVLHGLIGVCEKRDA